VFEELTIEIVASLFLQVPLEIVGTCQYSELILFSGIS